MGGAGFTEHGFLRVDAGFCPKVCVFQVVLDRWGGAVSVARGGESQKFRNYIENPTFTLLFGPISRGSLRTTTFLDLRDRNFVGLCSIDTHGALIAHLAFGLLDSERCASLCASAQLCFLELWDCCIVLLIRCQL